MDRIGLKKFIREADRERPHDGTIPTRDEPSGGPLGDTVRPALGPALVENAGDEKATTRVPLVKQQQRQLQRKRIWLAWLWVALWAVVIWQFGTDTYSLQRTSRFLQPLIAWLLGEVDLATRYKIYMITRKSAHFIEYAVLAYLAFRAALLTAASARIWTACWVALFFVATLAAADEIRQAYSSVRTGSPYDVLIDIAGGLVGLLGVLVISRRMRSSSPLGSAAV